MNLKEEQEVISLSEICRICLQKNNNMKHLLNPNDEVIEIITKISSLSNVEIEINDTLPCFLCNSCEEKLRISYDFQQLCQKSHNFLLACLSANSVSFDVNSFKPLHFENGSEKSILEPAVDNNTETFISFIDNDGLEKKVLVSYFSVPDVPDISGNDNEIIIKENRTLESCTSVIDNLNENIDNVGNKRNEVFANYEKPLEVKKKTNYNQTMRLQQYSPEDVNRIIEKIRERFFKHVNCLYCGFTAKDSRALSVHMTRLHKTMKESWCPWCNRNFKNLNEHKIDHKDDFKCPLCGKYKLNTGHFMEHLASHSIQRKYTCNECGKCFISKRHLLVHYRVHTKQKPYHCKICSKVFILSTSLKNHLKIHNKHRCKICKDSLLSSEDYEIHKCFSEKEIKREATVENEKEEALEDSSETSPKNYCQKCNRRVRSLENHMKNIHSDPVDHTESKERLKALCSYCGKRFKTLSKLTIHVRVHTGEMPYKCAYCEKRVATRVHLVVHERTHTGEKPHLCKFCGKGFAQTSSLNTHMKQHTGRPEECPNCHKRFCRPSELRQHMRTHTGEKPFECNICGQGFTQRSHLVGHSKIHSSERPYKCSYCDKSFKQASSLRTHTYIHLGRKPYKCSQCPYASRQSYSLKQHMVQHENEPKSDRFHKCEICGQCFTSFDMYSLHYSNDHVLPEEKVMIKENFVESDTGEVIGNLQEFP